MPKTVIPLFSGDANHIFGSDGGYPPSFSAIHGSIRSLMMPLDFFEKFRENLTRLPDHLVLQAVTEEGRESFTYRKLAEELTRVSLFLQQKGLRPGQALGIVMENHPRWGIAFLAAQSAGAASSMPIP